MCEVVHLSPFLSPSLFWAIKQADKYGFSWTDVSVSKITFVQTNIGTSHEWSRLSHAIDVFTNLQSEIFLLGEKRYYYGYH